MRVAMCQVTETMMYGHSGRELYARNLKLLVPFFDSASITLQNIEKVVLLCKHLILVVRPIEENNQFKLPRFHFSCMWLRPLKILVLVFYYSLSLIITDGH